jgi:Cdc6-like AAA superfamily ATPase
MEFKPYSFEEMVYILKQRVMASEAVSSYCDDHILEKIIKLAGGNARIAIQTLRSALLYAQDDSCESIKDSHLRKASIDVANLDRSYILQKLSKQQIMILAIIQKKGEILSNELWDSYIKHCKSKKIQPIAYRTFSHYVKQLIELGLVSAERALVRGRVRVLKYGW